MPVPPLPPLPDWPGAVRTISDRPTAYSIFWDRFTDGFIRNRRFATDEEAAAFWRDEAYTLPWPGRWPDRPLADLTPTRRSEILNADAGTNARLEAMFTFVDNLFEQIVADPHLTEVSAPWMGSKQQDSPHLSTPVRVTDLQALVQVRFDSAAYNRALEDLGIPLMALPYGENIKVSYTGSLPLEGVSDRTRFLRHVRWLGLLNHLHGTVPLSPVLASLSAGFTATLTSSRAKSLIVRAHDQYRTAMNIPAVRDYVLRQSRLWTASQTPATPPPPANNLLAFLRKARSEKMMPTTEQALTDWNRIPLRPSGALASRTWGIEVENITNHLVPTPDLPSGWQSKSDGSLNTRVQTGNPVPGWLGADPDDSPQASRRLIACYQSMIDDGWQDEESTELNDDHFMSYFSCCGDCDNGESCLFDCDDCQQNHAERGMNAWRRANVVGAPPDPDPDPDPPVITVDTPIPNGYYRLEHPDGTFTFSNEFATREVISPVLRSFNSKGLRLITDALGRVNAGHAPNGSPGLHVHVGATDLDDKQLASLLYAYSVLEPLLEPIMFRATHDYCGHIDDDTLERAQDRANGEGSPGYWSRYLTVNLRALDVHNTVEFRGMGAYYNYAFLVRWAWFCREMVNVAKAGTVPAHVWARCTSLADAIDLLLTYGLEHSDKDIPSDTLAAISWASNEGGGSGFQAFLDDLPPSERVLAATPDFVPRVLVPAACPIEESPHN